MNCDTKASEIALNQDNTVFELTVESKVLQVGGYRNELAGGEPRHHRRTALELLPQVTFPYLPLGFSYAATERDSFVHFRSIALGF